MTAIAFDGKTLAADTMYNYGGHKGYSIKMEIVEHPIIGKMIVALCGTVRGSSLLFKQLETNTIKQIDDYDVVNVYGIAVDSKKNVYNVYGDGYCVIEHPKNQFIASGSCMDFLYGAMYAGASAERAIGLAMEYRTDAGNECQKMVWAEVFKGYENERFNDDIPY